MEFEALSKYAAVMCKKMILIFGHLHSTGTTVLDSDLQKWILDAMGSFPRGHKSFVFKNPQFIK